MILYLHGFNSSSASSKAQAMVNHCGKSGIECVAPDLPHHPAKAAVVIKKACGNKGDTTVIGSSLGGYYATWLVENNFAQRGVLINPAVDVAKKLSGEVGKEQANYHDGTVYNLTQGHIDALEKMNTENVSRPERYLLLVQKGDEVLDYKEAVSFYEGCEQVVESGGDHSFEGFERHLDRIVRFANAKA